MKRKILAGVLVGLSGIFSGCSQGRLMKINSSILGFAEGGSARAHWGGENSEESSWELDVSLRNNFEREPDTRIGQYEMSWKTANKIEVYVQERVYGDSIFLDYLRAADFCDANGDGKVSEREVQRLENGKFSLRFNYRFKFDE